MHLLMLLEADMEPVPEGITIVQDFGYERVIAERRTTVGTSILISGEPAAIKGWLGGKEVWTSSNPLMGSWTLERVQSL